MMRLLKKGGDWFKRNGGIGFRWFKGVDSPIQDDASHSKNIIYFTYTPQGQFTEGSLNETHNQSLSISDLRYTPQEQFIEGSINETSTLSLSISFSYET